MLRIQGFLVLTISFCQAQTLDFEGFDFSRADSIGMTYPKADLKDLPGLALGLTRGIENDAEKFRVIFRWIAQNISYDPELFIELQRKERKLKYDKQRFAKWKKRFDLKVNKKLFRHKKTICSGYAWLLERMCREAGLECATVTGHGRTDIKIGVVFSNHAWNAVRISGKWYLTDPTWASGYVDAFRYHRRFNKLYFLSDPDYFIHDHYADDKAWILMLNKPTLSDFLSAPLKTEGFIRNKVVHYLPSKGVLNVRTGALVEFGFTSNLASAPDVEAFVHHKKQKESHWQRFPNSLQNPEGYYVFHYAFNKKGYYQFEIYINGSSSFVYDVYVK